LGPDANVRGGISLRKGRGGRMKKGRRGERGKREAEAGGKHVKTGRVCAVLSQCEA
jgi:hypothetical protein